MGKYNLGKRFADMTLPSGQGCQVRRNVKLQDLIDKGIMPSGGLAEMFPGYVPDARVTVDETKPLGEQIDLHTEDVDLAQLFGQLLSNPDSFDRLWQFINETACYVVARPQLLMPPSKDDDRDPDAIYVDYVEADDRAYLFNYALGGADNPADFARELNGGSDDV